MKKYFSVFRDLYGTIGLPTKLARTVVIGKKAELVKKILYILSYFIRCSDVHENSEWGSISSCLDELVFEDSPNEMDKGEITPIQEVSNGNFTYSVNNGEKVSPTKVENEGFKYYVESENKKNVSRSENTNQSIDISKSNLPHIGGSMELQDFNKYNVSGEPSNDYSSDKENSYCDKKLNPSKTGSSTSIHSVNENVLAPPNGLITCKLKKSRPSEVYLVENSQLVQQAVKSNLPSSLREHSNYTSFRVIQTPPDVIGSNLVRSKSLLSQQLEEESGDMKTTIADIKRRYLKEGSNSLFDEYFDGTETKTIDDVALKDLIVNHPIMKSTSSFVQNSTPDSKVSDSKPSFTNNQLHHRVGRQFSEVSTSAENLTENRNEKRIRHWSFGHALRPQHLASLKDGIVRSLAEPGHEKRLGSFSNASRPRELSFFSSGELDNSHGIRPKKPLARQGSFDKTHLSRQNPHAPGRCR